MLVKGIIEQKVDIYSYKVRIPFLNKISQDSNPTSTENLSVATISTIPGIHSVFEEGDVVFIDFENDDFSDPVILGKLDRDSTKTSYNTLDTSTLNVNLTANLPEETYIGNITPFELNSLKGIEGNIQQQLSLGGNGDSAIVIVEYNSTETEEGSFIEDVITEALSAGKMVFVHIPSASSPSGYDDLYLPLISSDLESRYWRFGTILDRKVISTSYEFNDDWSSITVNTLAPLASPSFTGSPTAPTPTTGTNSTRLATTAFVNNSIKDTIAFVEFGVATNAEVYNAQGNGKLVIAYKRSTSERCSPLVYYEVGNNTFYFSYIDNSGSTVIWSVDSSNAWSEETYLLGEIQPFARKTGISSLANLKTQLTTWVNTIPDWTIRSYFASFSGTWSPFTSGAGVWISIEKGIGWSTATFKSRNGTVPKLSMMTYNGSAWSDFYTFTTS